MMDEICSSACIIYSSNENTQRGQSPNNLAHMHF
uniref:Uncharacterized protein n=1 Tax=Anguilla anguilla TaxID=7936 RepID=A0A0E9T2U0_ANGAN